MSKEYAIWGVPPGASEETLLVSQYRGDRIADEGVAKNVAKWCESKGATAVRVQVVDLGEVPDFVGVLKDSIKLLKRKGR